VPRWGWPPRDEARTGRPGDGAVGGQSPFGDGLRETRPGPAGPATETLVQRAAEEGKPDSIKERAAQPVSLDDACVQRVVKAVGGGDELEVRPGTLKRSQGLTKPSVDDTCRGLFEQRPMVVAAAVPQLVGRVRVPSE